MDFIPDKFTHKLSTFKLPINLLKDFEHLSNEDLGILFKNILNYFNLENVNIGKLQNEFEVLILRIFELNKFTESNFCYLIKMFNEDEEFIKIGFSDNIEARYEHFNNIGYVVQEIYKTNHLSKHLGIQTEKYLHKYFYERKYNPLMNFSGRTECFDLSISFEAKQMLMNLKS